MKKNGFVFIETIISIVVLTSALVLLYSTFSKLLQSEKTRVYYDDINYIYRTWYLKNELENLNLKNVLNELSEDENKYYVTIGTSYSPLFVGKNHYLDYITNLIHDFDVSQIIIIKENKIDNIRECTSTCLNDTACVNYSFCQSIASNLSDDFVNYLKSVHVDLSCIYVLAIEYNSCNISNTNCRNFYSWISV